MIRRDEPVPLVWAFAAAKEARVAPSERADRLAAEAVREVCDPVTSILIGAEAAKRWLSGDAPNLAEARDAIELILCGSRRAANALAGVRDLIDRPSATSLCELEVAKCVRMGRTGSGLALAVALHGRS